MVTKQQKKSAPVGSPPPKDRRKRRTMSQSDMLEFWTERDFLIPQRIIYLGSITTDVEGDESGVDAAKARRFEIAMRSLEYFDPKGPITIIMNSPGGSYYHGMAIYDRIMDSPCQVTIIGTGAIMSMGVVILQAADKRLLTRSASIMTHYGSASHCGHLIDHERSGQEATRLRLMVEEILLAQMQKKDSTASLEKVREILRYDSFMDANKAIRLGLADGHVPRTKHKKPKVRPAPAAPETPPE